MPTIESATQAPARPPQTDGARMSPFLTVFIDLPGLGIVIPLLPMFLDETGVAAMAVALMPPAVYGYGARAVGMLPLGSWRSHPAVFLTLVFFFGYGRTSPSVAIRILRRAHRHVQNLVLVVNQSAMSMMRNCGPLAKEVTYQLIGPAAPEMGGA